jgi:hypothetical protein
MTNLLDVTIPGVIESPAIDSNAEVPTDAEYAAQCRNAVAALDIGGIRKELATLTGSTVVLPDGVVVEFIEPTGDAFKAYQDAIRWADEQLADGNITARVPIVIRDDGRKHCTRCGSSFDADIDACLECSLKDVPQ